MGFTRSESSILLIALVSFLQLSEVVSSSVVTPLGVTTPMCAPGSRTFEITTNNVLQITVCFDYTRQAAIWSYHEINGQDLKNAPSGLKRKDNWRPNGLDNDVVHNTGTLLKNPTNKLYQDVYRKKANDKGAEERVEYLARGHLTPNADFASQDERDATFYFINAAPQWQYFNGITRLGKGHWLELEEDIRAHAQKDQDGLDTTLHVITGTDGVLNVAGQDWYLTWKRPSPDDKMIPVPKFFWKIVWDNDRNEGAAFVGSNQEISNMGSQGKGKMPHPNAAGNNNFPTDQCPRKYANVNNGIIWCYTINDISTVIPDLQDYFFPFPQGVAFTQNAALLKL